MFTVCQYHRALDLLGGMKVTCPLWTDEVSNTTKISSDLGLVTVLCSKIVLQFALCILLNSLVPQGDMIFLH